MGCGEGEVLAGRGSAADGERGQVVGKGEFFWRSALFRVRRGRYDCGREQGRKEELGLRVAGFTLLEGDHLQSGTSPFPQSSNASLKPGPKPICRAEIAGGSSGGHLGAIHSSRGAPSCHDKLDLVIGRLVCGEASTQSSSARVVPTRRRACFTRKISGDL